MPPIMTCTIEKVLSDARVLVNRLREHETQADDLISQGQVLHKRVDAMKQYQEDLNELNEVARHRPRSSLIINLLQENTQIRELQQENKELRLALEEHQSALEMIMTKYRQQVLKLVLASKLDKEALQSREPTRDNQDRIDKICEMAAVMKQAILVDDEAVAREQQLVSQLKLENNTLRELLHIANNGVSRVPSNDACVQTESAEEEEEESFDDSAMDDIIDSMFDLNSSMISVKQMKLSDSEPDNLISDQGTEQELPTPVGEPETPTEDHITSNSDIPVPDSNTQSEEPEDEHKKSQAPAQESNDKCEVIESTSPAKSKDEDTVAANEEKSDQEKVN